MINLITGYKRTGKDTLVKMLNGDEPFNWIIYKSSSNFNEKHFVIEPSERIGFADKLRSEVDTILNMDTTSIDYNVLKELIIKDGKTYRDFLIEHGALRRNEDINYWVSRAINWDNFSQQNKISERSEKYNILEKSETISITDWRYPNELDYISQYKNLNITTIRLYRSNIPVPPDDIISEHQLDNVSTDFLLVPNEEDFKKACKLFPQYNNYIKTNMCCNECYSSKL